jgi:hypothetical protein
MGQSAPLNFLQIINAPAARPPHDTGRHVLTTRFEPVEPLVCEPLPLRFGDHVRLQISLTVKGSRRA